MKANELRIGNWVIDGITVKIVQLQSISKIDNDVYIGIELTPEILEKCGFGNKRIGHHDTAFLLKPDWRKQPSFHMYIEYTDSPFKQDNGRYYPISHEIKYLHQLQNLYYALTRTELEIKL